MKSCAVSEDKSWACCERGIVDCTCGFNSPERIVHVLTQHNKWRRGETDIQLSPIVIGLAIDVAIEYIKAAKKHSNMTSEESNYSVFTDCHDITVIDNLIDFSKKEQRELYFETWQLIQAKENLRKALESLK